MARSPGQRIIFYSLVFAIPLAGLIVGTSFWYRQERRSHHFDSEISAAAARYKIDPMLVKAVIWRESNFNPKAKGTAGEIGLMQIRDEAAFEWAEAEKVDLNQFEHEQLWDPSRNIHAGAWYLSKLMKRYTNTDNPLPYALADYNAGRTHVRRWNKGAASTNSEAFLEQMDYPGTRKYAQTVMDRYEHYRKSSSPKN